MWRDKPWMEQAICKSVVRQIHIFCEASYFRFHSNTFTHRTQVTKRWTTPNCHHRVTFAAFIAAMRNARMRTVNEETIELNNSVSSSSHAWTCQITSLKMHARKQKEKIKFVKTNEPWAERAYFIAKRLCFDEDATILQYCSYVHMKGHWREELHVKWAHQKRYCHCSLHWNHQI